MRDTDALWDIVRAPIHVVEPYAVKRHRFFRRLYWTLAVLVVIGCGLAGLSHT
jgi:hypothetical protein